VRGYCCLFFKRHAVDLHDLTEGEGAAYMRDIQRVSRALKTVTGAVKMNYDIHGNVIPHVHTHFYPRYVGDPFEGGPINFAVVTRPIYAPGEWSEFVTRLQAALAEPGPASRGS
jgi:diadenosine tetraphosphate (Ap4A) HIT family hydrolase